MCLCVCRYSIVTIKSFLFKKNSGAPPPYQHPGSPTDFLSTTTTKSSLARAPTTAWPGPRGTSPPPLPPPSRRHWSALIFFPIDYLWSLSQMTWAQVPSSTLEPQCQIPRGKWTINFGLFCKISRSTPGINRDSGLKSNRQNELAVARATVRVDSGGGGGVYISWCVFCVSCACALRDLAIRSPATDDAEQSRYRTRPTHWSLQSPTIH